MDSEQELFKALQLAVINGESEDVRRLAEKVITEQVDPLLAIEEGLSKGIKIVGDAFGSGELFLPDLIISADALKEGTRILAAELKRRGIERKPIGVVVIGTCAGDIHDIGKTIVATMLTANGFQVYDLGVNVPSEQFLAKILEVDADILALSALLTTTMVNQQRVIETIHNARLVCKVMVGGGPVTKSWSDQIGADGYGRNAAEAVTEAKALLSISS